MSDLTITLFVPSPEKQPIAQATSAICNSDDEWNKFADEHQNFNTSLDDNERAKWRATSNVKIKLAKNLDKSNMVLKGFQNYLRRTFSRNGAGI